MSSIHTPLFVEALDVYLLHFAKRCPAVTPTHITSLIQLIEQHIAVEDERGTHHAESTKMHFDATKSYIARKRTSDPRFEDIELKIEEVAD